MIKVNVITSNDNWLSFIKRPNYYLDKKINKLNLKNSKFKKKHIFCTLLLSGEKEIKYLNKKFRKKNKSTDILSFPFYEKKIKAQVYKNGRHFENACHLDLSFFVLKTTTFLY